MKKKTYRLLAVILTAALLIGNIVPVISVYAEDAIPTSYDLRDYGLITSVKHQGLYGACWSFATCAASESNMIKQGLYGSDINLSELQLAYFCFNRPNDPLGNTEGDCAYINQNSSNNGFMSTGGDSGLSGYTLMTWAGPVLENEVPYTTAEDVMANGLDDSYAYLRDVAHLQNVFQIPMSQPNKVKQAILDFGALWISFNDFSSNPNYPCYNRETGAYYNLTSGAQGHAVTIAGWDDSYAVENFLEGHRPSSPGAWLIKDSVGTNWGNDGYWWASYEDLDFGIQSTRNAAAFVYEAADNYDNNYQYDGGSGNFTRSILNQNYIGIANVFTAKGNETLEAVSFSMSQYSDINYQIYICKNLTDVNNPSSGDIAYAGSGYVNYKGYQTFKLPENQYVSLSEGDVFSVIVEYLSPYYEDEVCFDIDKSGAGSPMAFEAHADYGQSFYTFDMFFDGDIWYDLRNYSDANIRIKAYTTDVGKVHVDPKLEITGQPTQLSYIEGQNLNLSGLTATYTNGAGIGFEITNYTSNPSTDAPLTLADNGKEISITYNGITVETGATISVAAKQLTSLELVSLPNKRLYGAGESFNPGGMALTAVFDNGDRIPISVQELSFTPSGALSVTDEYVTASYTFSNNTKSVSIPVTVRENVALIETIEFSPSTVNVYKNETTMLSPICTPEGSGIGCLLWSSSDTDIVQVDESGVVTAVAAGTAVITAVSTDGSGKSASCTVNVLVSASGVSVSPSSKYLAPGDKARLTANVSPFDTTDKTVTWSSDNTDCVKVSSKGTVTAVDYGSAVITATTLNGFSSSCTINVVAADSTEYTGFSGNLINDGTEYEITTYTGSSSTAVMPRVLNGLPVTAIATNAFMENSNISHLIVADSVTRIGGNILCYSTRWVESVTIPDSVTSIASNCFEDCYTTIKCYENSAAHKFAERRGYDYVLLYRMRIIAPNDSLNIGEQMTVSADVTPSSYAADGITWTSGDTRVASVDQSGVVTGKARGSVLITAVTVNGAKKATFVVNVQSPTAQIDIFSYTNSFSQKIDWWQKYSTANMSLGFSGYNCSDAVRYEWTSGNDRVKIDQKGNITNVGSFARSSVITLTAYDIDGNVVAKSSVKVSFYKFMWQSPKLQGQSTVSDSIFRRNLSADELELSDEANTDSVTAFFTDVMNFIFSVLFNTI